MAYNYQIPYQPQFFPINQPMLPTQMSGTSQTNGIIWVQGEAGAKSYLVAPNTTVQLWDSEAQTIYLKSADASGMPSIKTLDYTIRGRSEGEIRHENVPKVEFVTREEFDALKRQIETMSVQKKTEVKDDE